MKALTLTLPWAPFVMWGAKWIETRSWATSYRGPLAIHAAKGLGPVGGNRGFLELCRQEPFFTELIRHKPNQAGMFYDDDYFMSLPRGAIIAICTLLDCVPTRHPNIVPEPGKPWFTASRKGIGQHYYEVPPPLDSNEYAFGDYSAGRFAWLLADVQPLAEPIPCKGALGLWQPDATTMDAVRRQVQHGLQRAVWATYRPGQEVDKRPSAEYLEAARAAINAVALKEAAHAEG